MGYLEHEFRHDLFISYSHGDFDGTGQSALKDWSSQFVEHLREEIRTSDRSLRDIAIFLDQSLRSGQGLDPTEPLTDQLKNEVAASALLAILVSDHYINSTWCLDELRWWQKHHGIDLASANGRIFSVHVMPTKKAAWPRSLVDEKGEPPLGTRFHRTDNSLDPGDIRPYKWRGEGDREEVTAYRNAVVAVAGLVRRRLLALQDDLTRRDAEKANAERLQEASGQLLYLHGKQDDAAEWTRVWQDLGGHDYVVFPTQPEVTPADDPAWQRLYDNRVETLVGCDALLLLHTGQNSSFDSVLVNVGHLSRNKAKARSGKPLPCAVVNTAPVVNGAGPIKDIAKRLGISWLDESAGPEWRQTLRRWLSLSGGQLQGAA